VQKRLADIEFSTTLEGDGLPGGISDGKADSGHLLPPMIASNMTVVVTFTDSASKVSRIRYKNVAVGIYITLMCARGHDRRY
jgi:hypothetical protein